MADIQWYFARNEQQFGPVLAGELKQLAAAGGLDREDLVWREGMEEWAPAGRIKGLFADSGNPAQASLSPVETSAPQPTSAEPLTEAAPVVAQPAVNQRPVAVTTTRPVSRQPVNLDRALAITQAVLWGTCVAVILIGGIMFLLAISRAEGDNNKIAAAGAIYMTFFISAYVIARAGEKVSRLLLDHLSHRDE